MSEENAQHPYTQSRILIDSARVVSSAFPQAVVVLNGKELEILRNLMGYARVRETFVGAYHDNYYLVADDDDWLNVETTVAILEGKLMGNDNTVWGYYDRLITREDHTTVAPGSQVQSHPVVPEGEVWVVLWITLWTNTQPAQADCLASMLAVNPAIAEQITVPITTNKIVPQLNVILKEDDLIKIAWSGLANNQRIISEAMGYKMKVPT